jgi:type IV secretory pathway VirJ component
MIRTIVLLSCGAAVLSWGGAPQAAVVRQVPFEKLFSTAPEPQFTGFLYAPKVPETGGSAGLPVIFYSSLWGWVPMQQDAASYLATTGRFVLGIDSTEYFKSLTPADLMAEDLSKFRSFVNDRAGRPKESDVILLGFGSGAEIIPYLLNQAGATGVRGVVLIAPGKKGSKVIRVAERLKMDMPADEALDVEAELRRMAPLPVAFIEGSLDFDSAAKALSTVPRGPHKYATVSGGDHQFHDVRDTFFGVLADALHWIDGATKGPAAAPSAVPTPRGD